MNVLCTLNLGPEHKLFCMHSKGIFLVTYYKWALRQEIQVTYCDRFLPSVQFLELTEEIMVANILVYFVQQYALKCSRR